METKVDKLLELLEKIKKKLDSASIAVNANTPFVVKEELIADIDFLLELITTRKDKFDIENDEIYSLVEKRLNHLDNINSNQLRQNPQAIIPAFLLTLERLKRDIGKIFPPHEDQDISQKIQGQIRKVRAHTE